MRKIKGKKEGKKVKEKRKNQDTEQMLNPHYYINVREQSKLWGRTARKARDDEIYVALGAGPSGLTGSTEAGWLQGSLFPIAVQVNVRPCLAELTSPDQIRHENSILNFCLPSHIRQLSEPHPHPQVSVHPVFLFVEGSFPLLCWLMLFEIQLWSLHGNLDQDQPRTMSLQGSCHLTPPQATQTALKCQS